MQKNKIILKKMIPNIVVATAWTVASMVGMVWVHQNQETVKQKHPDEKNPVLLCDIEFIGLLASFILASLLPAYKHANNFAGVSAKNYIKKTMSQNPKLKEYESLLQNSSAMKRIATIISNELCESEQKDILNLVKRINLGSTTEDIMQIHNEIAKVIGGHAATHPEFNERVYNAIVNADYLEYVKKIQHENMQRAKGNSK